MTKPMNEQPKYVEIVKELDDNFKTMRSMRPLPSAAIKRYREEMDILTSYASNAIEGNTFTYDETRLLIKEGVTTSSRSLREHNDIAGHSRAYWSLYESLKNKEPITTDFILNLHAKVLQGDDYAGRFRNAPVYVGDDINISYVAPASDKVPGLIDKYVNMVQPEMNENIADLHGGANPDWVKLFNSVAKHHIEFERIHPFFDGNGRTGRLLLNYELLSAGLVPITIPLENRARYGAAFQTYDSKAKYSTRSEESKYERMSKLLAETEVKALKVWNETFAQFVDDKKKLNIQPLEVHKTLNAIIHKERPAKDAEGLPLQKGEDRYTLRVYDGASRTGILERDDGEYIVARGLPNQRGELAWDREQKFGSGADAFQAALNSLQGSGANQSMKMD